MNASTLSLHVHYTGTILLKYYIVARADSHFRWLNTCGSSHNIGSVSVIYKYQYSINRHPAPSNNQSIAIQPLPINCHPTPSKTFKRDQQR